MLISAIVGIDLRSTLDMDATIRGFELSEDKLLDVLNEIIKIDINDDVTFEITNIITIREEDEYGGYRITLKSKLSTIITMFKIDITTGDVIIPKEINYQFKPMFKDGTIDIIAYNLETVMSEKFHSVISHGVKNTRARDFYDIYILTKFQRANYDNKLLAKAIEEKFISRDSKKVYEKRNEIIETIENSTELRKIWYAYSSEYIYANDITFENVLESVKQIANLIKNN
jgi:hypothetical protein